MSEELKAHTFVAESMTVETGRIIPSPALAEAVIGGIAQIIAERDALKAQWASVPWEALRNVLIDYYDSDDENMVTISVWRFENAPRLTDEQAAALVELIRKA